MKDFIFLFRSEENNITKLSPEEMQNYISKWAEWTKKLVDKGSLKHGDKLSWKDARVVSDFGNTITDGPFIESKEVIGGYMIIHAENLDEAVKISMECPVFHVKGTLEIRTSASQM